MNKKNKKCLLIILIYNLGLVNILFNWKAVIYIYTLVHSLSWKYVAKTQS